MATEGIDEFLSVPGGRRGGDMYIMTKRLNMGDDVWLKRVKQFAMHYMSQGDSLRVDVVLGLNDIGRQLSTEFPSSVYTWSRLPAILPTWVNLADEFATWSDLVEGVMRIKRVRFAKKDHFISFRIYQNSALVSRARVGPWSVGFKYMRRLRVR
jgi:hypothetical protein